jgi:hypothetical protein
MEQRRQVCAFCAQQGVTAPEPERFVVPDETPAAAAKPKAAGGHVPGWVSALVLVGLLVVPFVVFCLASKSNPITVALNLVTDAVLHRGESGPATFEVHVTTQPPAAFTGAISLVSASGSSNRSVEGTGSATYSLGTGTIASVQFQKKTTEGTISVELIKNGQLFKADSTTAEYGVVGLAGQ